MKKSSTLSSNFFYQTITDQQDISKKSKKREREREGERTRDREQKPSNVGVKSAHPELRIRILFLEISKCYNFSRTFL